MNKPEIKLLMVDALKLAEECVREANVCIHDEVLIGILTVKIFDVLSEARKR